MIDPKFHIVTDMQKEELAPYLKLNEPWRIEVSFSNGLSTKDFKTFEPYSDVPLKKLEIIAAHSGEGMLKNKRVLDVGCNIGYNAIVLTRDFGCQVTGIDFNPANIEKAGFFADVSGLEMDFRVENAITYCEREEYDLILHLGTLYHLSDPFAALKSTAQSLKPGGRLYIETAVYGSKDENACRCIHGLGNDFTNYWALSHKVIAQILERNGLSNVEIVRDVKIKLYKGTNMSRAIICAEKN